MSDVSSWLQNNWVSVTGAVCGITGAICGVGSFWLAAICFRDDRRSKLVAEINTIEERYNSLWSERLKPELNRIFEDGIDLLAQPMTLAEDLFLRRIIMQFETGWRLEKAMNRGELYLLARDVGSIFDHPLPRAMWEKLKYFRNRKFVSFVERAIKASGKNPR